MGELIEFVTVANESSVKYKWLGCVLSFEVKAAGNVVVGLTRSTNSHCEVWVIIGKDNNSFIWRHGHYNIQAKTIDILSDSEYRKFWITWHSDVIKFGKDGETEPLLSGAYLSHRPGYVSFGLVEEETRPAHWRLEMPPQHIWVQSIIKPVNGGKPEWVKASNQLPEDAIVGGCEKDVLYIIRAPHRGSLTPGKFLPSEGVGYIPWGGQAHEKKDVEVLRGYDCVWMKTSSEDILVGAIEGGYAEHTHETLYVGRATHEGSLIPGKVQPSHKLCYIAYDGLEIAKHNYEILVSPFQHGHSSTRSKLSALNLLDRVYNVNSDGDSVGDSDGDFGGDFGVYLGGYPDSAPDSDPDSDPDVDSE